MLVPAGVRWLLPQVAMLESCQTIVRSAKQEVASLRGHLVEHRQGWTSHLLKHANIHHCQIALFRLPFQGAFALLVGTKLANTDK